jgi:hypothetical protein
MCRYRILFLFSIFASFLFVISCKKPAFFSEDSPHPPSSIASIKPMLWPMPSSFVHDTIAPISLIASLAHTPLETAWRYARNGDPIDLMRLAHIANPLDLSFIGANKETPMLDRETALRALAYLDDPTYALDALLTAALSDSLNISTLALQSLAQLAFVQKHPEEHDAPAWKRAAERTKSLLASIKDRTRRELAIRCLLGFAEHRAIAVDDIPEW